MEALVGESESFNTTTSARCGSIRDGHIRLLSRGSDGYNILSCVTKNRRKINVPTSRLSGHRGAGLLGLVVRVLSVASIRQGVVGGAHRLVRALAKLARSAYFCHFFSWFGCSAGPKGPASHC